MCLQSDDINGGLSGENLYFSALVGGEDHLSPAVSLSFSDQMH
jgi:hypothetical protein